MAKNSNLDKITQHKITLLTKHPAIQCQW